MINIDLLKEHPRNKEFFDDIEGERWKEFVESIKTSGIIVPLIITQDYIVISGNQRLKAAKEIGLTEVNKSNCLKEKRQSNPASFF